MSFTPRSAPPGSVLARSQAEARKAVIQARTAAEVSPPTVRETGVVTGFSSFAERTRELRAQLDVTARSAAFRTAVAAAAPAAAAARALKSARTGVAFDEHQLELIHAQDRVVIGEAVAGSGKTTTSIGFADARPDQTFLYMCFGADNAAQAQKRFGGVGGGHVTARTTHGLAWRAGGHTFSDRLVSSWRPREIAAALGIDNRLAACVGKTLASFYASVDGEIDEVHLATTLEWGLSHAEQGHVLTQARKAWRAVQEAGSPLPVTHDTYLKLWALTNPRLDFDYLILDEAQDTNPLTEQLVMGQLGHCKLLAIGDRHQSIYGFRGATNAMENLREIDGCRVVTMPRTWRFGQRTAEIANQVLRNLKGETVAIQGMGTDGGWTQRSTLLTRTNAGLFDEAVTRQGRGMHWVGGVEKYNLRIIEDAYRIWTHKNGEVRDPYMRRFRSWGEVVDYADSTRDAETRSLIKLVETHKSALPTLIAAVVRNEVKDPAQAELQLTTAHKAKGMEYDCVRLGEDFEVLYGAEKEMCETGSLSAATEQEINLIYVGITRAKRMVRLNTETEQWLAELPRLQIERMRALGRGNFHAEAPRG